MADKGWTRVIAIYLLTMSLLRRRVWWVKVEPSNSNIDVNPVLFRRRVWRIKVDPCHSNIDVNPVLFRRRVWRIRDGPLSL